MLAEMPEVTEHAVFYFFPFSFDPKIAPEHIEALQARPIADLHQEAWLPLPWKKKLEDTENTRAKTILLWQPGKAANIFSTDFFPHLRRILGDYGSEPDVTATGEPFSGHKPFDLSTDAINMLSGEYGTKGQGLSLPLTSSAAQRLGMAEGGRVQARITTGRLFLFGTGTGLVLLELNYGLPQPQTTITLALLNEINNALTHTLRGKREFFSWHSDPSPTGSFMLWDIVQALAGPIAQAPLHPAKGGRIFTYTAAKLNGLLSSAEVRRQQVVRLSKGYTSDYQIPSDILGCEQISPFSNITHGAAIEGGCLLVEAPADAPPFVTAFLANTLRQTYLPIAIVAFHEFQHLIELTQESDMVLDFSRPESNLAKLESLRDRTLAFRLCYRFSHASLISQHNLVHQMWRRVFELEPLLALLSQDVTEAQSYLAANAAEQSRKLLAENKRLEEERMRQQTLMQQQREQRWRWWGSAGAGIGALLAGQQILALFLRFMGQPAQWELTIWQLRDEKLPPNILQSPEVLGSIEMLGTGVVLAFAVAVSVCLYRKNSPAAKTEQLSEKQRE